MEKLESQEHSEQSDQLLQEGGETSFIRACFNGINVLSGIGVLSMPFALSQGGWFSLVALFLVALLCFYTGLLMKKCMDINPLIRTYPDIGGQAFGPKGRLLISSFMYLELFLLAVEFLILQGDNLHNLFPKVCLHKFGVRIHGKECFVLFTALLILPTTWLRSLSILVYVSVGGVLSSIILVENIAWIGLFEEVGFSERGSLWRSKGLPTSISLYTFCYCGHAVFPTLCTSMKDKTKFPKVLLVCFVVSTITYCSMAILGYMMFGENLMSQVTLNLPTKKMSSKIAIYMTLINPITKYALILSPIASTLEERWNSHGNRFLSIIIRTMLVISTVVVALLIPFFGYVMTFIGAFLSISAAILFPCLCYLKLNKVARPLRLELFFIIVVLSLGIFVAVTGTFVSVRNIVKHV